MKSKFLAIVLVLTMVIGFLPVMPISVNADDSISSEPIVTEETEVHSHCVCGGTQDHEHTSVNWEPWTGTWESGGHYYLTEDVEVWPMLTVAAGDTLYLCLNGHTVTGNPESARMFAIRGTLHLCDHTGGQLISTYAGADNSQGHVFYVYSGASFYMYGGEMSVQGEAYRAPVGVVNGGAFYLYDGVLNGGTASDRAGNLWVYGSGSAFHMFGGMLTDGQAGDKGGNLYVASGCDLRLYGGTITAGSAANGGGGVYTGQSVYVGGDLTVSGNIGTDLMLAKNKVIQLDEAYPLTVKNGIGIALEGFSVNPVFSFVEAEGTENFFFGNGNYSVCRNDDGKLELTQAHSHCICNGSQDHTHTAQIWEPWTGEWVSGGYYYLTEDLTSWSKLTINAGDTLNLCLNGHTITSSAACMLAIKGNLNLCDHKQGDSYKGELISNYAGTASSQGHVFYLYAGGSFNMYGGKMSVNNTQGKNPVGIIRDEMNLFDGVLTGGVSTADSGNLYIAGDGVLNMYGGTVTGGETTGNGGNVYVRAGEFNMFGGTVSDGKAENGGNIAVYAGAEANISGGMISGGDATKGGAVYVAGTATIADATVQTGTGTTGRVIYIADNGELTLEDANINDLSGNGTCIWNVGQLNLKGIVNINVDNDDVADIMLDTRNDSGAMIDISDLSGQDATYKVRMWGGDREDVAGQFATGAGPEDLAVFRASQAAFVMEYAEGKLMMAPVVILGMDADGQRVAKYASAEAAFVDTAAEGIAYYRVEQDLTGGTITQPVLVDLAGYDWNDLTIAQGVETVFIDSATNDYDISDDYAKVTLSEANEGTIAVLANTQGYMATTRNYVTLVEDGIYSFHRYYASVTAVSLDPSCAALGYKATFRGDEMVQQAVTGFGYHLWIQGGMPKTFDMPGAQFADNKIVTLRLKNILSDNEAVSQIGATAIICGDAYISFSNGETVVSAEHQTSLKETVEAVNASVVDYNDAQLEAVKTMCQTYATYMEEWAVENILNWPNVPFEYQEYTFSKSPSTTELREMAVKAMADMLNVRWTVGEVYSYEKASTGDGTYTYNPGVLYAGLPYSQADGSLIQWYEFYNTQTGRLELPEGGDMNILVGNTCAGAVCAAWSTVCNSISGFWSTGGMVPKNGFIPVGSYVSDYTIGSYASEYPTQDICADNGVDVMLASYAQILEADALVSTKAAHAVMAIYPATVVCTADGAIDPQNSYVIIQDQRGAMLSGGNPVQIGGQTVYYNGRIEKKLTFAFLWENGYIPVTAAEFMGTKAYTQPEVSISATPTVETVDTVSIRSNYPICVAKLVLVDNAGNETILERILLTKRDVRDGNAFDFALSQFTVTPTSEAVLQQMTDGQTYRLVYRVSISNGQVFDPLSLELPAK